MCLRKGFTILESLIVLAILGVITMVVFALINREPADGNPAKSTPDSTVSGDNS